MLKTDQLELDEWRVEKMYKNKINIIDDNPFFQLFRFSFEAGSSRSKLFFLIYTE